MTSVVGRDYPYLYNAALQNCDCSKIALGTAMWKAYCNLVLNWPAKMSGHCSELFCSDTGEPEHTFGRDGPLEHEKTRLEKGYYMVSRGATWFRSYRHRNAAVVEDAFRPFPLMSVIMPYNLMAVADGNAVPCIAASNESTGFYVDTYPGMRQPVFPMCEGLVPSVFGDVSTPIFSVAGTFSGNKNWTFPQVDVCAVLILMYLAHYSTGVDYTRWRFRYVGSTTDPNRYDGDYEVNIPGSSYFAAILPVHRGINKFGVHSMVSPAVMSLAIHGITGPTGSRCARVTPSRKRSLAFQAESMDF